MFVMFLLKYKTCFFKFQNLFLQYVTTLNNLRKYVGPPYWCPLLDQWLESICTCNHRLNRSVRVTIDIAGRHVTQFRPQSCVLGRDVTASTVTAR